MYMWLVHTGFEFLLMCQEGMYLQFKHQFTFSKGLHQKLNISDAG